MSDPIIVIGSGLAGWSTVRELRRHAPDMPVMVITTSNGDAYAKPALSNALALGKTPAALVGTPAAQMVQAQRVTLLAHTRLLAIDRAARRVRVAMAEHEAEFAYSQLVLALGAQPIRLPLAGDAAARVHSINSLEDYADWRAVLAPGQRVAILGGGLIGCEFANDLIASGHAVSVIDPAPGPIAALLPAAASEGLRRALAELGVQWHLGTTATAVNRSAGQDALQVQLASGQVIEADHVLSAVGLRPATAIAAQAGLAVDRGICVDAWLRTSDPHIFALGDSAQYASAGERVLPYVQPILVAARALGATLAGQPTAAGFPVMPVAIKTPALPLVVSPPPREAAGRWSEAEPGLWQFIEDGGRMRGFALAGSQTARRLEQARLVV